MKTIHVTELSKLRMAAGNEKRIRYIIDDGMLLEWVGIGWVDVRETTEADKKKYPTVVRD